MPHILLSHRLVYIFCKRSLYVCVFLCMWLTVTEYEVELVNLAIDLVPNCVRKFYSWRWLRRLVFWVFMSVSTEWRFNEVRDRWVLSSFSKKIQGKISILAAFSAYPVFWFWSIIHLLGLSMCFLEIVWMESNRLELPLILINQLVPRILKYSKR